MRRMPVEPLERHIGKLPVVLMRAYGGYGAYGAYAVLSSWLTKGRSKVRTPYGVEIERVESGEHAVNIAT